MAQAAAIGKKKKKRKGRGFVVNRNTYIRRNTTAANTPEGGAIVTAGELLFAAAGLGIGYLLFQYFTTKAATTPTGGGTTTLPNPTPTGGGTNPVNFTCRLPADEVIERRINGAGCGCADCRSSVSGRRFNFKNETI